MRKFTQGEVPESLVVVDQEGKACPVENQEV
jgi:hypothetical protein